ncbi:hypothetical protein ACFX10_024526 [Malus domestica]
MTHWRPINLCNVQFKIASKVLANKLKANASECIHVMNALRVYEVASRKKINLSKSKVCFSRNVKPPMKNRLNLILGVRYVSRHEKYLGMPSKLERETP